MAAPIEERNQDATVYVGGLDEKVTEAIIWELFLQAGPVVNVHMPKDRITGQHQGYGFVEFQTEDDADYAMKIMNMIKLYGKPMRAIWIREVDEKLLFDTFSAFGVILQTPKIMRDPETGNSRGFAFINYASFEPRMNGIGQAASEFRRGAADAASAASSSIHVNVHADAATTPGMMSAPPPPPPSMPYPPPPPPPPPPQGMRLAAAAASAPGYAAAAPPASAAQSALWREAAKECAADRRPDRPWA
uniref:RRM domain-containing protein n=1 Tax=Macrostomum lignano TaxID=282301 RepID=A0A1I8FFG1_9PLAT